MTRRARLIGQRGLGYTWAALKFIARHLGQGFVVTGAGMGWVPPQELSGFFPGVKGGRHGRPADGHDWEPSHDDAQGRPLSASERQAWADLVAKLD